MSKIVSTFALPNDERHTETKASGAKNRRAAKAERWLRRTSSLRWEKVH